MEQPKFNLSDCTKEDSDAFMKDFGELLDKHSLYFEPVPQFIRTSLTDPWRIVTQIFLQKKTKIAEDKSVPSPFTDASSTPTA